RLKEKEASLQWLRKALDLGLRSPNVARTEDDLKSVREDAQFKEMVGIADPKSLSRDEGWRYDLRYLAREIRRLHFNPYRNHTRESCDAYVKELDAAIPKLNDAQIEVSLIKLAAMAGDGHTVLRQTGTRRFLPVQFYQFSEGVFITAAAPEHGNLAGAE